jgi:spore coat protein U-like protein
MRALTTLLILTLLLQAGKLHAASLSLAISALVLSKNQCKFNTASGVLNFGNLDPSAPTPITRNATLTFTCRGSDAIAVYLISDDNGLYETGPGARRMRTPAGSFIPYGLSYTPNSGSAPRNVAQAINLTGTLTAGSYATAPAGAYSDTVILTIVP